eukprot:TRINITY_DN71275_c0_g1_i1.p1 TRINITY_DN71275_c0_g1~~TRINITY_DN71275_c0_g1_i1.p1  ORF type:complete len:207 (+),score=27.63 TRINITY_DN71275_c0_g1_i1:123-743(+)
MAYCLAISRGLRVKSPALVPRAARRACGSIAIFPRGAVAVTICRQHPQNGRREYLLAQRSKPPAKGFWSIPGGKIELGESALHAGAREVAEETGLRASDGLRFHPLAICTTDAIYPLEWSSASSTPPQFHYLIAHFFAWSTDWHARVTAGDDAAALRWVTMEELKSGTVATAGNVSTVFARAESLLSAAVLKVEASVSVEEHDADS